MIAKSRWWLIALLVVIVILPAMLVLNRRMQQDYLDNRNSQLRAASQPTIWNELVDWFLDIPEDQNAAESYYQAFDAFVEWDKVKTEYFPVIGMKYESDLHELPTEEIWQSIAAYLADNHEALRLLNQAADQPHCQFLGDTTLPKQKWFSRHMKSFKSMRMACKLLCLEAIFQGQQGDSQYATDALLAEFYLADAFDSVPLMVDWLVQLGCRNLVISKSEQVMNTVRLTDEQLSNIIEYIYLILESESLRKVWITELGYNLAYPDDTYGHFTSPEVGFVAVDNMIFNAYDGLGFSLRNTCNLLIRCVTLSKPTLLQTRNPQRSFCNYLRDTHIISSRKCPVFFYDEGPRLFTS